MKQLRFSEELIETYPFDKIGSTEHIGYKIADDKGCFAQIAGNVFAPIDFGGSVPNRFSDECNAPFLESIKLMREKYPSAEFFIFNNGKQLLKWLAE